MTNKDKKALKQFNALLKRFGGDIPTTPLTNEQKVRIINGQVQFFPTVMLADGSLAAHSFELGGWRVIY